MRTNLKMHHDFYIFGLFNLFPMFKTSRYAAPRVDSIQRHLANEKAFIFCCNFWCCKRRLMTASRGLPAEAILSVMKV